MSDYIVVNMLACQYFQVAFCLLGDWDLGEILVLCMKYLTFKMMELLFLFSCDFFFK